MRNRLLAIIWSCLLAATAVFGLLALPTHARTQQQPIPFTPTDAGGRILLHVSDKPPPPNAEEDAQPALARRQALINTLQTTAAADQQRILTDLQHLSTTGDITSYRSLWIINAIAVEGSPDALALLARHPDVVRTTADQPHTYFSDWTAITAPTADPLPNHGIDQIRARHVWDGLGIDGQGVTIAIVDTGVDWQHPDLQCAYRGNLGNGRVNHTQNWFHSSIPTATAPFDPHGHGTHVTGTAVGQNGIGVAPGARWIAAAIADENGIAYDSDIHAAFQWLLAPGGNPAAAPDVVSNSWGGAAARTEFLPDVNVLHAAGIITVFAAGNNGPASHTINTPAAFEGTIAVGAVDQQAELAWFSARGPSPHTPDPKPLLTAPGTAVFSTLPNATYGRQTGTSMATPHVAGAVALLLSAQPELDRTAVIEQLANTATVTDPPHPNQRSGYGQIDAFAAAAPYARTGTLAVRLTTNGQPRPSTPLTIVTENGSQLPFTTDADGRLELPLQPGRYSVRAAPFGSMPANTAQHNVTAGQTTAVALDLTPLPTGRLTGQTTTPTGTPLQANLAVLGTPIRIETDANGRFELDLPAGTVQLQASAIGHRIVEQPITIGAGASTSTTIQLPIGPRILLVDSGAYRFTNGYTQFSTALTAARFSFDTFPITAPAVKPTLQQLAPYDVVIWSAPDDSPGRLGANSVITDYLGMGGRMLISGQNVGDLDGRNETLQSWWRDQLQAAFVGETAVGGTLRGAPATPFEQLAFTLNGGSSANNQQRPDIATPRDRSLTREILTYADGSTAGLAADACADHRLVYFGFGLEGVTQPDARQALIQHSMSLLLAPPRSSGAQWLSGRQWQLSNDVQFALPGQPITTALDLQHLGEVVTDTFRLEVNGRGWTTDLLTPTLTLGPCARGSALLTVHPPPDAPSDAEHTVTLTAVSQQDPAVRVPFTLTLKTPGRLLLVDDDRFFDREAVYTAVLDDLGLRYDIWETGWNGSGRGSPPLALLEQVDTVIWFTGYDWRDPVTQAENATLFDYVAGGGRLFLSSQDYAYWNGRSPFASRYLGLLGYQESITPTQVWQSDAHGRVTSRSQTLTFDPYQNFGDGLIVGDGMTKTLWHDGGLGGALYRGMEDGRVMFWAIPFETLPPEARATALQRVLGQLGDLGDAAWEVDARQAAAGAEHTYTLTLRLPPTAVNQTITLTNPLPDGLTLLPDSLTAGASYNPASHVIEWHGAAGPGDTLLVRYRARTAGALPDATAVVNPIQLASSHEPLPLTLEAVSWVNAADLSESMVGVTAVASSSVHTATYVLTLTNAGLRAASPLTAALRFPTGLKLLTDTVDVPASGSLFNRDRLTITKTLPPGESLTATFSLTKPMTLSAWAPLLITVDDGQTAPVLLYTPTHLPPYRMFLPAVGRP